MSDTYVFNEVEVKKTGRSATKPIPGGKQNVVFEITPVDQDAEGSWKKWVMQAQLFTIETNK